MELVLRRRAGGKPGGPGLMRVESEWVDSWTEVGQWLVGALRGIGVT